MSLLMDALKKAEQAKRQGQAEPAETAAEAEGKAAAPKLELLEHPPAGPAGPQPAGAASASGSLPELPSQLDVLDAEFIDHLQRSAPARPATRENPTAPPKPPAADRPAASETAASPKPRPTAPHHETGREAAKNVFDAKQAPAGRNKAFAIAVGSTTLIAAIGIGVYFWMQLKPAGGLAPVAQTQPRPAPPAPTPVVPSLPAAGQVAPATAQPPAPSVPTIPAAAEAAKQPAEIVAAPIARPAAEAPIRITASKVKLNPALVRAFDALNAGSLAAAQADYAQVLAAEPKNPDALHGMAAIALRQGQYGQAEEYYLRAIEADPKDAIAQAGLFGLRGQTDPASSESRLKVLIAAQPDQHFLNFALGNIYAAAGRWNEAQQAFFKAYTGDAENPDYLFNLAISLDHLRQSKLAAQYYNQAVAAADNRPASFDKAQAAARLRELQP